MSSTSRMRAEPGAGAGRSWTGVASASIQDPASAARDCTATGAAVRRAGADAGGAATVTVQVLPDPGVLPTAAPPPSTPARLATRASPMSPQRGRGQRHDHRDRGHAQRPLAPCGVPTAPQDRVAGVASAAVISQLGLCLHNVADPRSVPAEHRDLGPAVLLAGCLLLWRLRPRLGGAPLLVWAPPLRELASGGPATSSSMPHDARPGPLIRPASAPVGGGGSSPHPPTLSPPDHGQRRNPRRRFATKP